MDSDDHALYEQAIKAGLDAIETDRNERDAQRREEMRQPIEPKAPPVIIVRETTLAAIGYAAPEASATIAGDGGGGGPPPDSGSGSASSSSSVSSSASSSSSAPSSSSSMSSSMSSSSSVPSSSSASSSASMSSSSSSSSIFSFSGSGSGSGSSSSGACCNISIEAFVSECDGASQTVAVSIAASCTNEACTAGAGTITINGTPFVFNDMVFAASIDIGCPAGGNVFATVEWSPDCDCQTYEISSSSPSCDGLTGRFDTQPIIAMNIALDGSGFTCV